VRAVVRPNGGSAVAVAKILKSKIAQKRIIGEQRMREPAQRPAPPFPFEQSRKAGKHGGKINNRLED
jgi:hypothetical protein